MKHFWMIAALALVTAGASAAPPADGTYETHESWGTLVIQSLPGGTRTFTIEATGANAHQCSVEGVLRGTVGTTDAVPACLVQLDARGAQIEVTLRTPEACRYHCGARATFDGSYFRPRPECRSEVREQRKDRFLQEYKARRYAQALALLEGLERQCGEFFGWREHDSVRNDLAITLFHLGRKADCLAVLKATQAASLRSEKALQNAFPPAEFDSYLTIAQATWNNEKKCGR